MTGIKRTINLIGYMSVSPTEDSYNANINVPIANDTNQTIDKVIINPTIQIYYF